MNESPLESPAGTRPLEGAAALVTGASSGIGQAIAFALGAAGASVILAARQIEPLERTAVAIRAAGGDATVQTCDLLDHADIARLAEAAGARAGERLAVLVHAAGLHVQASIEETPMAELERLFRCNVHAPFLLTRLLLPALRAARGDVVFINSSAALSATAGVSAYAASKAALKAFADALRHEVNKDGVRVLSVFPGRTATPMQAALFQQEGRDYLPELLLQPADVAASVVGAVCLDRTAELTDLHIRPARKV